MPLENGQERKLERDGLGVGVEYIGEGRDGDYDERNEEDVPLARFWLYAAGVSEEEAEEQAETTFRDTSYCFGVEADAPDEELSAALEYLWRKAHPTWKAGGSMKRVAEMLSWADGDDVRLDRIPKEVGRLWLALSEAALSGGVPTVIT